jgi:hypothetical protein
MSPEMRAAVRAKILRPCLLFYYDYPNDPLRLWAGIGRITWGVDKYTGAGIFISVTPLEQTTELQTTKMQFVLSGVQLSDEAKKLVLTPARRVRTVMYRGFLDRAMNVIPEPIVWFDGYGDPPSLQDKKDGTSTITLSANGRLFNLVKPKRTLLSHNEQEKRFPGDTGLSRQANAAQETKQWTIGAYNNFTPPA